MTEEESTAACPHCHEVKWSLENVYNTTDGKGIIQAQCHECDNQFELEIAGSSGGWTAIPHDAEVYSFTYKEESPDE